MESASTGWFGKKPRTLEDKLRFRSTRLSELRSVLGADARELETKLRKGAVTMHALPNMFLSQVVSFVAMKDSTISISVASFAPITGSQRKQHKHSEVMLIGDRLPSHMVASPQCSSLFLFFDIIFTEQDEISNELGVKKMYIQGLDRGGRAVSIFVSAKHDVKKRDPEEMSRLMCYTIDKQLDKADVEINPDRRITIFFDLSDVSVTKSIDLSGMHHLNDLLSHHYVMRLGKLYVYNAPMLFWATWKAFSVFIPKDGLKMIQFLYPKDLPALHEEIPPEILPKIYKGKGIYIPVQDA